MFFYVSERSWLCGWRRLQGWTVRNERHIKIQDALGIWSIWSGLEAADSAGEEWSGRSYEIGTLRWWYRLPLSACSYCSGANSDGRCLRRASWFWSSMSSIALLDRYLWCLGAWFYSYTCQNTYYFCVGITLKCSWMCLGGICTWNHASAETKKHWELKWCPI